MIRPLAVAIALLSERARRRRGHSSSSRTWPTNTRNTKIIPYRGDHRSPACRCWPSQWRIAAPRHFPSMIEKAYQPGKQPNIRPGKHNQRQPGLHLAIPPLFRSRSRKSASKFKNIRVSSFSARFAILRNVMESRFLIASSISIRLVIS